MTYCLYRLALLSEDCALIVALRAGFPVVLGHAAVPWRKR